MSCSVTGIHNLTCNQGATFKCTIVWTDPARKPIDLTGYTARMQVRETYESQTVSVELTTENGRISLDPLKGEVNLTIDAESTAELSPGLFVYDLELVSEELEVTRLLEGNFNVRPEVTRPEVTP